MEKERYTDPEMKVILLETEDIIISSGENDGKTASGTIFDSGDSQ